MNHDLNFILRYLENKRGFDFSGLRLTMLDRRISKRITATETSNFAEYLEYLEKYPDELDKLVDVLTINVSRFFRDTFSFEFIEGKILPSIVLGKIRIQDNSLRIWSAGCASGEEAYSMAILINELMAKESLTLNLYIFATDIDRKALDQAQKAVYSYEKIKDVRYRMIKEYFIEEVKNNSFTLVPDIKKLVNFSFYDILDRKSYVPPESVYGNFDLVLCRNVLIYFNKKYQNIIFNKLHHSIAQNGYLILGEAEVPTLPYQKCFKRLNEYCHIYKKI